MYNFLQTCVMKYTFRYLVARGIQKKNIFRYNSVQTRSPLIALLYCTTVGGGRLPFKPGGTSAAARPGLNSNIVLLRSPNWLRLHRVSGLGPQRGGLVAPRWISLQTLLWTRRFCCGKREGQNEGQVYQEAQRTRTMNSSRCCSSFSQM